MISRKKKMSKILRKNSNGVKKRFNSRLKNKSKKSIMKKKKSILKNIFKRKRSIMKGGVGERAASFIGSTGNKFTIEFPPENINFEESKNSFFQFKYSPPDSSDSPSSKPMYFTVNPIKLSVDILQFYINKAKQNGRSILVGNYLQLNENTITLELLSSLQYRSGNSESFIDIYESLEIDKEIYKGERLNNMYQENLVKMCNRDHFQIYVKQTEKDMYAIVQEDISWLKAIMMDLNKLSGSGSDGKRNIELFLEKSKTEEGKTDYNPRIFSCVDLDVDHSKIIIEEYKLLDDEEYVIVGYPRNTMRSYLDLYNKNKENKEIFDSIYGVHKSKFMEYMAGLHNFIPENKIKISLDNLNDEIHNFYGYESYYLYTENFYKNAFEECISSAELTKEKVFKSIYGIDYDPEFQSKFKTLQKAFYNELASKCLNKPMMQIQYIFIIFKKLRESNNIPGGLNIGDYVPAVFNFRELTHKHHPILQRLETVIKSVLPNRYGITDSEAEEYKLWYSHYNYGDVFHIKTEYVHTMSNIQQQAYKYKNSITLEELIYMLSTEGIKLQNLKVEYQKKDIRFSFLNGDINRQHYNKEDGGYVATDIETFFYVYKESLKSLKKTGFSYKSVKNTSIKSSKQKVEEVKTVEPFLDPSNLDNVTILLMFVETGNIYTFVYESSGTFYILKLKPNLTKTKIAILNYLVSQGIFQNNTQKIKNIDINNINLYEVLEHRPIKSSDYKSIMRYNPLLVRTIKKRSNKPTISISEFFDSPLITISSLSNNNIMIPNPYNQKPFVIRNFLATKEYIENYKKFMIKYNKNLLVSSKYCTNNKNLLYKPNFDKYVMQFLGDNYNKEEEIYCIYFNYENSGYNLIEIQEKTKKVIWIVPFNSTSSKDIRDKYLSNFLDLRFEHINILELINKLYFNNKINCFINTSSILAQQVCLHIHIYENETYKTFFADLEQGSRINSMLSTKTIINLLNFNPNYFKNYKTEVLIHDKS